MSDEVKKLKAEVRCLRKELNESYSESRKLRSVAIGQRDWIEHKFNWWIDLMAQGKKPDLPWMIKNAKDILVSERFY